MKIQGKLEYAPELRFTPAGHVVCTFTIIYGEAPVSQRCEMWAERGEAFADLDLTTGDTVAVAGPLRVRTYEDCEGTARSYRTLNVREYAYLKGGIAHAVTQTT